MLKKITAAALSTALCITASIPFTGSCTSAVQPLDTRTSTVRSEADIPVPSDLRKGETPVSKGDLGENILYFLYEDGTVYIKGSGKTADFTGTPFGNTLRKTIKKAVFINDGDGITYIGSSLFCNCPALEEVELPDTVTVIGSNSFSSCPELAKINLPKALTTVGVFAFADDKALETIELPDLLQLIDRFAFHGCSSLKELKLPETLPVLRAYAFADCTSLTEVTVPEATKTIGPYAFSGCSSLKKAVIKGGSEQFGEKMLEKCTALEELTVPSADGEFFRENNAAPSKWFGFLFGGFVPNKTYAVSLNGDICYIPNSFSSITVTGGTEIADDAFRGFSSLTSVTVPDSITRIGDNSFNGCKALSDFTLPSKTAYIGSSAFNDCGLLVTDIPEGVTVIGDSAFAGCASIKEINIPEVTESVGNSAFSGCSSLTKAVLRNCKKGIGKNLFDGCSSLEDLTIPYAALSPDALEDEAPTAWLGQLFGRFIPQKTYSNSYNGDIVYVPNTLSKITITGGTKIPSYALSGFSSLREVSVPDDVTFIGEAAFGGCYSMEKFNMPSKTEYIGVSAFLKCEKLDAALPEGVKEICDSAFMGCSSLTEINVPDTTERIGKLAFSECSAVTKAVLRNCKKGIGKNLFDKCSSLEELTLPYAGLTLESVNADNPNEWLGHLFGGFIPDKTYSDTYNGDIVYIPYSLTKVTVSGGETVPANAFSGFKSLKAVSVPDNTAFIGDNAFNGCSSLSDFSMPSRTAYIGSSAFNSCSQLVVDIPKGVAEIGDSAFADCTSLTEITVPVAAETIGNSVFSGCSSLKKAVINGGKKGIGTGIFDKCSSLEELTLPFAAFSEKDAESSESKAWLGHLFGGFVPEKTYSDTYNGDIVYIPYSLNSIVISGGSNIPDTAFTGFHTEEFTLPKTVANIGDSAFNGCNSILNVFFPDTQEAWDKVTVEANNESLDGKVRVLGSDGKYKDVVTKVTTTSAATTTTTTSTTTTAVTTAVTTTKVSDGYSLGDVDNNKAVNAVDASLILTDYAMTSTNKKSEFTGAQKKAADADNSGSVNAVDASYILEYYAYTSTTKEKPLTMSEYMDERSK